MVSTFYFSYDEEGHTFYEDAKSLIYNTDRIEDCYVFIGDTTKEKIEEDEEAYDDNYRGEGVIEYLAKKETDAHKQKGMKEAYKKQNKKQSATIKKLRAEIEELKDKLKATDEEEEDKKKKKEEFYKQKIQEAKDKKIKLVYYKGKEFKFEAKWDELPPEVVEIIINHKEKIEFVDSACGSDYNDEGYMLEAWKKYDITGKSVCDYLFNEYKNENGEGLTRCFSPTWSLSKFLWCMINNKSLVDEKYHQKFKSKDIELDRKRNKRKNKVKKEKQRIKKTQKRKMKN